MTGYTAHIDTFARVGAFEQRPQRPQRIAEVVHHLGEAAALRSGDPLQPQPLRRDPEVRHQLTAQVHVGQCIVCAGEGYS